MNTFCQLHEAVLMLAGLNVDVLDMNSFFIFTWKALLDYFYGLCRSQLSVCRDVKTKLPVGASMIFVISVVRDGCDKIRRD